MKSYTDLEQSKILAEILPSETADMYYSNRIDIKYQGAYSIGCKLGNPLLSQEIAAWSLTALLEYLKNINSTVYIPMLYVHDNKWMLQFVERGHGNIAEVECDNPIDACYEMILKLKELNLL